VADTLKPGSAIAVPDVLFAKIEDDHRAAWAARFGGAEKLR
jgi:methionyl-tRNA synthetase